MRIAAPIVDIDKEHTKDGPNDGHCVNVADHGQRTKESGEPRHDGDDLGKADAAIDHDGGDEKVKVDNPWIALLDASYGFKAIVVEALIRCLVEQPRSHANEGVGSTQRNV